MELAQELVQADPWPPDQGRRPDKADDARGEQGASGSTGPSRLESLALDAYLKYLEGEAATYVALSRSKSVLLAGVAKNLLQTLKNQLNENFGGTSSIVIRGKMMSRILSEEFPTANHCPRLALLEMDKDCPVYGSSYGQKHSIHSHHNFLTQSFGSSCLNPCCSGQFIREAMAAVVMSSDIKELLFTAEKMPTTAKAVNEITMGTEMSAIAAAAEFDVPAILTHLLSATQGKYSQLERIIFSEGFVKDDDAYNAPCVHAQSLSQKKRYLLLRKQQQALSKELAKCNICDLSNRGGVALNFLILFRDVQLLQHNQPGFHKLTELVLKNNVQCELYSKASFQFEFLQRIGRSCPNLRVLDLLGTDTWADCLVALFFKDAFHSLHRYLFFMENEDDENSAYHPHDITQYCQFCLDQLHPNYVERRNTINPVIPLVDEIYNHVLKKYPKRSFCILRNCVRVSDLLASPSNTVFELVRRPAAIDRATPTRVSSMMNLRSHQDAEDEVIAHPMSVLPLVSSSPCIALPSTDQPSRRSSRIRARPEGGSDTTRTCKRRRLDLDSKITSTNEQALSELCQDKSPIRPRQEPLAALTGVLTRSKRQKLGDSESSAASGLKSRKSSRTSQSSGNNSSHQSVVVKDRPSLASQPTEQHQVIPYQDWLPQAVECQCPSQDKCRSASPNVEACLKYSLFPTRCDKLADLDPDQGQGDVDKVQYREISNWPHLNPCTKTLEVLNIGGTNILGEFIPFILLHAPRLRSLGEWLNTMIYGLEILKNIPAHKDTTFPLIEEFSYSTDRNYFCQPYIGFVVESTDFRNVRKEMMRFSSKVVKRLNKSIRNHSAKRSQIQEDMKLLQESCPNVRKLYLVIHYPNCVLEEGDPWQDLNRLSRLTDLDLVTMRFANVRTLLTSIGEKLTSLSLDLEAEQGNGSEIVHIARSCPNLKKLRLGLGERVLRGEMTLHFGSQFFRNLEHLVIEGSVHLHAFAFLWGHCRNLKFMKIGIVVSNEALTTNVLIYDVLILLFRVNRMACLEELHIKDLKIRSIAMGIFLVEKLPLLKYASNWILDFDNQPQDLVSFKEYLIKVKSQRSLTVDFKD